MIPLNSPKIHFLEILLCLLSLFSSKGTSLHGETLPSYREVRKPASLSLCCTAYSIAKMSALFPDSHSELGGLSGAHCVVSVQSRACPLLP